MYLSGRKRENRYNADEVPEPSCVRQRGEKKGALRCAVGKDLLVLPEKSKDGSQAAIYSYASVTK